MNIGVTSLRLDISRVPHRVVVATRDAVIRRESDDKEFGGLALNPGERTADFLNRASEAARTIEKLLGDPVVVTINGQDMILDRHGSLRPASKHIDRIERTKFAKKLIR